MAEMGLQHFGGKNISLGEVRPAVMAAKEGLFMPPLIRD